MSIALFDEPPRVSVNQPGLGCRNGLLMGMVINGTQVQGLAVNEHGEVLLLDAGYFRVDYRYDAETDKWVDENAPKEDQE